MGRKPKSADSADRKDMTGVSTAERKVMEAVAKHMRHKVPTKSAVIKGQKVEYFYGCKAVDCLMDSKWTAEPKSTDSEEPYFVNRTFAVDYCNKLLREDFFVRAEKVDLKHVDAAGDSASTAGSSEGKEGKTGLRKRGEKVSDSPRPKKQGEEGEKKVKRKFRLDYHRQQIFLDSKEDIYYWKYDPPSYTSYLIGFAVVVGAIAMTLQPLWPESSRHALWYASVGVLSIMGVMVVLIIVRWVVYGIVLVATGGKLSFWILPNLDSEKTGFLDSFKPLHSAEWAKPKKKSKKKAQKPETPEIERHGESGVENDTVKETDEHGNGIAPAEDPGTDQRNSTEPQIGAN